MENKIVTGENDEYLINLKSTLEHLEQYGMRANCAKCKFFKEANAYCGHHIDVHGLHKSQEKIKSVLEVPQGKYVSQLRSFLGFLNYCSKLVPT